MTRRLPSTTALVALEAAARHLSFAKAAQELALSEGAISRQIAKLEAALGVRLFNRVGNRVELSAAVPAMPLICALRSPTSSAIPSN